MTNETGFDTITGAFGYTGKYLARQLLKEGRQLRTLTGNPNRENPFGDDVRVFPFSFDDHDTLVSNLRGCETFYNTYWVRYSHGDRTFDLAVANTKKLFAAAVEAGVKRFVHVSITNPSIDSPLPYFSGKAGLEAALKETGLSHAIVRPNVLWGDEDILVNNIAWLLRRFPIFGVPGKGDYCLQPMYVEDMAGLLARMGKETGDVTVDAVGPDIFTFRELVTMLAGILGSRAKVIGVPPVLALTISKLIGMTVGDVMLTRDELIGLMDNLLISSDPPTGTTHLEDWAREHKDTLGREYHSEIRRHFR